MALAALVLLATSAARVDGVPVPFKSLGEGLARTPQLAHVKVLRDRRPALDFLVSLKSKGNRFLEMKYGWDWKVNEAVAFYPGYLPAGSKVKVESLVKEDGVATLKYSTTRSASTEMVYPVIVLRVPKSDLAYQLEALAIPPL